MTTECVALVDGSFELVAQFLLQGCENLANSQGPEFCQISIEDRLRDPDGQGCRSVIAHRAQNRRLDQLRWSSR